MLRSRGLRVEVDGSSNRMQYKIRTAQEQKVPYMVVLGDREIEARTASPRTRAGEQQEAAGLGRVRRPPGGGVEGADDRVALSAYIRRMQGSSGSVSRPLVLVDVAIKVATVGLLAWAILNPDLPQFSGKAFTARALVYPIGLVVLPIGWWLFGRSRMAFPVVADILIGLPFLIDVAGNAARPVRHHRVVGRRQPPRELGAAHGGRGAAPASRAVGLPDPGRPCLLLGGDDGRVVGARGVRDVRARFAGGRHRVRATRCSTSRSAWSVG